MIDCEENNLIPCTFRLNFKEKADNFLSRLIGNKDQVDYELKPLKQNWNLYDPRTRQAIDPLDIVNNEKILMSQWELGNFAIQVVRNDLEKEGNKILSFCDLPEVNPQIWFENKKGKIGWIIVKYTKNENEKDYKEWGGLEEINTQLKPYDGYFASVQIIPSVGWNGVSEFPVNLFRGDGMIVNYKGLEGIYVS